MPVRDENMPISSNISTYEYPTKCIRFNIKAFQLFFQKLHLLKMSDFNYRSDFAQFEGTTIFSSI